MTSKNSKHFRKLSRRQFLKTTAAATLATTALSNSRVFGAGERLNIGLIGFGLIGRIHARSFKDQRDCTIAAVAETYRPRLDAAADFIGGSITRYSDFRRLLDNKNIDAVVVATPDHWHCLMTMMACAAGKDVYCEKPLTLFVKEGRWMIDCAKKHNRVVQVGTQQRSGPHFQKAKELVQQKALGDLVSVQMHYFRNVMPGFGNPPDSNPPPDLDYDMWLGPAPKRPYNPNRSLYHFRWFWDYSGGQMTNLGQHSLDIVHWFTGTQGPKSIYSTGGRFHLKDNCEVPDTQDVILEYPPSPAPQIIDPTPEPALPGTTSARPPIAPQTRPTLPSTPFFVNVQWREAAAGGPAGLGMGGLVFQGTHATMPISRAGFDIIPDPKVNPQNTVAAILGGHPIGGPQPIDEPKTNSGPPPNKINPATPSKPTNSTQEISWTASSPAINPTPTSNPATKSPPPATSATSPSAPAENSFGTPKRKKSKMTPKHRPCSPVPTAPPGIKN
jgi:predicted dehydrogenase